MELFVNDTGGTGDPIILIHGWPLSSDAWEPQIPALVDAGYRVIAYDRRGFGKSDKPGEGFDYDTLAHDLHELIENRGLSKVTLVGFSMGGGEVARYIGRFGEDKLRAVVFASAVPPFLMKSASNPDGPLDQATANEFEKNLTEDRDAFFEGFTKDFFSADGELKVSEDTRQKALSLCHQSSQEAALGCMKAWATTDFREDLGQISVPTLVLHGTADGIVPIEGSGERTHEMVKQSILHRIEGAPHGCNTSHPLEFNKAILDFLMAPARSVSAE
ncbi:pimeloyl-ACP methyl ester carboxylesterase [Sagittula marina]|uniref:Pimeloyl-ACP methyl ester carboxylesterase n=1 Tax=Sagittula marina TaxID=943940 RepID=A0A7W6DNE9_9RHOB|nr:alpha/beta hydrolase [Sagittula marina]MBB3983790.1 pimeloyl-ACP methyl ester carboxylesterase [Sagittula marina]